MNRKGILYIISAPSGAGKTSICRAILSLFPNLRQSISFTTRGVRVGEQDGRDYHFVSPETFAKMVEDDAFVEWAEVHGNCYGTARATLEQASEEGADVLLEIDFQGAEQLRESGLDGVFIFILPPDMGELRRRLESRNTDDTKIVARRMANAAGEISEATNFDYLVVNDVLDQAVEKVRAIMIAETSRTGRVINLLPEEFDLK
ncbi:MAG: guanylate kinase [Desulfuromonadales bacterium]|nr:guanylate kinase [Desulfuromonadales bacterium]